LTSASLPEPPLLPKRRPALVWVISIFYAFSVVSTIASYAIVFSAGFPVTAEQKQYFSSLTPIDHGLTALVLLVNLTGAVMLFLLKKQAPALFTLAFAIGLATVGYQCATRNWFGAVGIAGLIGAVIGWCINLAIITYALLLKKRGVLS
jgi:hypothetical protein